MHQRHIGIVEILDDGVGGPGDGNQHTEAGEDEENPACERDARLGPAVVPGAGGALHAAAGHGAGEPSHKDGQTHEGPGRLDVGGQGQHGVVRLALHVARGLVDAVHPDALPLDLRGQDVAADKGRDLPLRQGRDGDGHDPAGHRAREADQLHASVHHDDKCLLDQSLKNHKFPFSLLQFPLICLSSFVVLKVKYSFFFLLFLLTLPSVFTVFAPMLLCQQPFSSLFLFLFNICSIF